MPRATPRMLTLLATASLTVGACSSAEPQEASASRGSGPAATCGAPPAADPTTAEGWLGYLAEHPDDVALVFDDGRGTTIEHRPDDAQPLASAVKVVHLAAYGRAVEAGTLRADRPVSLGEWERWDLAGPLSAAHIAALDRLGVPNDGLRANDPAQTVPLSSVVSAMIQESDNAATDLVRDLLGEQALSEAAAAGGWDDAPTPSILGSFLTLLDPAAGDPEAAARRFTGDPAYAAQVLTSTPPPIDTQLTWAADSWSGTATGLAALHRSISAGEPAAAREQLEWQPAPEGFDGLGFKGGTLPGVLTEALTLRGPDGTGVAVLLVRGMTGEDWAAALTELPHQQLLVQALREPGTASQLACAVQGA